MLRRTSCTSAAEYDWRRAGTTDARLVASDRGRPESSVDLFCVAMLSFRRGRRRLGRRRDCGGGGAAALGWPPPGCAPTAWTEGRYSARCSAMGDSQLVRPPVQALGRPGHGRTVRPRRRVHGARKAHGRHRRRRQQRAPAHGEGSARMAAEVPVVCPDALNTDAGEVSGPAGSGGGFHGGRSRAERRQGDRALSSLF